MKIHVEIFVWIHVFTSLEQILRSRIAAYVLVSCMPSHFSHVQLFVTLWTIACQAPLSTGFNRQEYWSGLTCPSPEDLPDQGIEPASLVSPTLQADSLSTGLQFPSNSQIVSKVTEPFCNHGNMIIHATFIQRASVSTPPQQHLLLSIFFIGLQVGMMQYFIVLICISLMTHDIKNIFICSLAHYIASGEMSIQTL